jgi:hypothetical protein
MEKHLGKAISISNSEETAVSFFFSGTGTISPSIYRCQSEKIVILLCLIMRILKKKVYCGGFYLRID